MSVPSRDGNGAVSFPVIPKLFKHPHETTKRCLTVLGILGKDRLLTGLPSGPGSESGSLLVCSNLQSRAQRAPRQQTVSPERFPPRIGYAPLRNECVFGNAPARLQWGRPPWSARDAFVPLFLRTEGLPAPKGPARSRRRPRSATINAELL